MSDHHACAYRFRSTDRVLFVGETAARPGRRPVRVYAVFHRHDGWTHLYRTDERDARTVHLVRAAAGDEAEALAAWARQAFGLPAESLTLAA